jgi:hypothetical protein
LQGGADDGEWLQEIQGTVHLTPGNSTIVYNSTGVPLTPNGSDLVAVWNNQGHTPPEILATWLTEDTNAKELIDKWGRLIYTGYRRRGKPTAKKQFDMTLLHGSVPHCGPDSKKFRAVLFFTAAAPTKSQPTKGRKRPAAAVSTPKKNYNDEQMSYEKLIWTLTSYFHTIQDHHCTEYWKALQFLYGRFGEIIAASGTTIGAFDGTLLSASGMTPILRGMISNLGTLSMEYYRRKTADNEQRVKMLLDTFQHYPLINYYKKQSIVEKDSAQSTKHTAKKSRKS